MAKISIVIADSDDLYLNHLSNYLISYADISFTVYSFTSKESLIKFISDKTNKVDIIAFTEDLLDEAIRTAPAPAKILLTDGSYSDIDEFVCVNKYQKAEKFIKDVSMVYAETTGRVEAVSKGDKATNVIGVYSPAGGSGKTTLALAVALVLANQGKRAFYFNAEKINSTAKILNKSQNGSMSDIYLALKDCESWQTNILMKVLGFRISILQKALWKLMNCQ